MRRFMGKYASGNRKAAEQARRARDWEKAQPLVVRKALKAEKAALVACCAAVDSDSYNDLHRAYDAARAETARLIEENRNV